MVDQQQIMFNTAVKVCVTLGPASSDVDIVKKHIQEGASLFRMNFAHIDHKTFENGVNVVREAARQLHAEVGIIAEMKGPDFRTGPFPGGSHELTAGDEFEFFVNYVPGTKTGCSVSFWNLPKTVKPGDRIMVEYARIGFVVKEVRKQSVLTVVENNGTIGPNKVVTLPEHQIELPFMSYQDTADVHVSIRAKVDFLAASGVRDTSDIKAVRSLPGFAESSLKLLVCVENARCVENLDEILHLSDGALVSRSNLMSNISMEAVPRVQKEVIALCNRLGKPVAIIHQVLTSMDTNPRPTRAEVTDCANAILDGVDYIILTNPTSVGPWPVESVTMLRNICSETEVLQDHRGLYSRSRKVDFGRTELIHVAESVASSAVKTSWDIQATAIVCFTESGTSAQYLSKYWPAPLVYCITPSHKVARQLQMARSCVPLVAKRVKHEVALNDTLSILKREGRVRAGDKVVVMMGETEHRTGATNQFRIVEVPA